jgi:hypothetical protein
LDDLREGCRHLPCRPHSKSPTSIHCWLVTLRPGARGRPMS